MKDVTGRRAAVSKEMHLRSAQTCSIASQIADSLKRTEPPSATCTGKLTTDTKRHNLAAFEVRLDLRLTRHVKFAVCELKKPFMARFAYLVSDSEGATTYVLTRIGFLDVLSFPNAMILTAGSDTKLST